MTDYKETYARMAEESQNLKESAPEVLKDFYQMHHDALKEKKLSMKEKELIALGISVAIRCEDCIYSHVRTALKNGATYDELVETVEVAIVMGGGPSTAYGSHALSLAKKLLAE